MNCNEQLTQQESVDSLDVFKEKILSKSLPSGFTAVMKEDCFMSNKQKHPSCGHLF